VARSWSERDFLGGSLLKNMKKVLVYGWYGQLNIGDDLFAEAFKHLFPDVSFVFHDSITLDKLMNIDAVFFGGGSFLGSRPVITEDALEFLKTKKLFYIGVGAEADIHPTHMELMRRAELIATRSYDQVDRLKTLNSNVKLFPDLAYCLQSKVVNSPKKSQSVLIMPNVLVCPKNMDPHWKHASWAYFKSEFSQFLDWLVVNDYQISFMALCLNHKTDDDWAAAELISAMEHRNSKMLLKEKPAGISRVTALISQYNLVITQRFHGIVLSEMTRTPYIAIHHHDKLKFCSPNEGSSLSYYHSSKHTYIDSFERTMKMNFVNELPAQSTIFETLSREVLTLI
jgi:polysaccharide pyruvyl transferase WcaK-like protein